MRILAVGDIVGESGVRKLKEELPRIKREENIDFVITNGENSAGGMGINERNFNDMLSAGTNVVTMGNHTWGKINILTENPFIMARDMVEEIKEQVDIIIIDFHAEATAEKIAMARYLDGKITAIFGTHTHVQTADEQILPNGTGYITDIGMTGPKNSVIGMDAQASIKRFETTLPEKYKLAEGECILNAVIFNIDDTTSKVTDIKRIYIR